MFNLQHHFQLFKEEGAKSRFIFFTGGEKPQEIADADKKEKVFEKEDLEDPAALKDKTKMEGQATINAALEQLNIDEELKAGIKQESKDAPKGRDTVLGSLRLGLKEEKDPVATTLDGKIDELNGKKTGSETFISQMKSFIVAVALEKIINIPLKDRKNYDRTVEIDGKKIHIFIKHRGREIESGVNDITP